MNVYRGMILNYVWIQTNWQCYERHLKGLAVYSRPQEPRDKKPDSRTAVLGAVLHKTRWVDGRYCLVGWLTRINDDRYPGCCVVNTLRVISATLNVIRALIGSQCRAARTGVMLSNFAVHITARASEFWSLWSLSMLDFDVPYKRLLQ